MKELLSSSRSAPEYGNFHQNNNENNTTGQNNASTSNGARRYAVLSNEWMGAMGEELGMHSLPDPLLRRLAEDASYRLREVLHKCVTRIKHSRRKRLTAVDVNAVLATLCDADPVLGAPAQIPEYHSEARVFVPRERFVNLFDVASRSVKFNQSSLPFLRESEITDSRLKEARLNYAKRALKTLFNGSQKTFQVLLNDCSTNANLGGAGVVEKLVSIARASIISTNAQCTRASTRTCQLIIAIASNGDAVYPHQLETVDRLTELLLELLFGKTILNPSLEALMTECVLKLMLRWPTTAHRFLPMLEKVPVSEEDEKFNASGKKGIAMEVIASVQPVSVFRLDSLKSFLDYASPGTILWQKLALSICALSKSGRHDFDFSTVTEHFGDSLLPYLILAQKAQTHSPRAPSGAVLPIIVRSKIKYAGIKPFSGGKIPADKPRVFSDSTLRGSRREIRFAFAGGRPVPSNNLRRASLRADYQILRSDTRATFALVASRRLMVVKDKKNSHPRSYDLANTII